MTVHLAMRTRCRLDKRVVWASILALLLIALVDVNLVRSDWTLQTSQIVVPDQYATIQEAINNAVNGDTILVKAGTYYEHVVVNKTISLVGEDVSTTIIDGNSTGHVINVINNSVSISGFTVQNSGNVQMPALDAGFCLNGTTGCTLSENRAINNGFCGISLLYSYQNTIIHNNLSGSGWGGIHLLSSSRNIVSGNIIADKYGGINGHVSSNYNNITENMISNCTYGMFYHASNYNNIQGNSISAIEVEGVWLQDQVNYNVVAENNFINNTVAIRVQGPNYNNTLSRNVITGAEYGIKIQNYARYVLVTENTIGTNDHGIWIETGSTTNTFYYNNFLNNIQHVNIVGTSTNSWDNGYPSGGNYWSDYNGTDANHDRIGDTPYVVDANNHDKYPLVNPLSAVFVPDQYSTIQAAVNNANEGDTVFVGTGTYFEHVVLNKTLALVGENVDNTIIDGSYEGVVVNVTRDGICISGFTIQKSGTTWNIGGPPYGAGVYMRNVTNCSIIGNRFTDDAAAIQLEFGADGNAIANNTMASVDLGWGTFDASMNSFIWNNVTSNGRGLGLNVNSDNNLISSNRVIASEWVIALHACNYNNITENLVADGQIGIYLPDSSENRIYHNQVINNTQQASLQGFPSHANYWDDGYPSGGNYWSSYGGFDVRNGVYQNVTGSDGIGDTPVVLDGNNRDRYPLMKPWFSLFGDINSDGKIDMRDVGLVARRFMSLPGDPLWDSSADINVDGKIDMKDISTVARHFGEHYP